MGLTKHIIMSETNSINAEINVNMEIENRK